MHAAEAANSAKLQEDMSRLKDMYESKLQKLEDKYKSRTASVECKSILRSIVVLVAITFWVRISLADSSKSSS